MAKKINFCTRKKSENCIFGSFKLFSGAKIDFFAIFENAKNVFFVLLKLHFFLILEHCDNTRFCATRRSAGIPYLIQALVTTEPKNRNYQSLELALNNLLSFCEDPREELRIHAYNILRSLYRDSSLGEVVSPYISKGLQVSILGFKAHTWPVSPSLYFLQYNFAKLHTL